MDYFFLGGGGEWGGYSCQTMNFVLLMLLDVNRVNAAAYPEPQIRGGLGGGGDIQTLK